MVNSNQADEAKAQKLIIEAKQKADLRIASVRKQFENESAIKSADLSSKCHELELMIKKQNEVMGKLREECVDYANRIER